MAPPPATAARRLVTAAPRLARQRNRPGTLEARPATAAPHPARARNRRATRRARGSDRWRSLDQARRPLLSGGAADSFGLVEPAPGLVIDLTGFEGSSV